ncbi:tigger transposable element-derived protein 3-like [Elysia marginata]|uniref:Tigger transposable element-derived protein 3-like n=1 Tax=Elysia marginata TaxID=1093978 RepID=A0AAV4GY50_9GAST|nr:tigger transposable element-derived protein 3-like [Elysia marginata]
MTDKVAQGARLSGHLLKKKATELAASKGEIFNPSNGWLYRWKQKNGVAFKKEHGEKQAANFAASQAWRDDELLKILDAFEPRNIFNADKTGLYFRGFPDRGHGSKSTELTGGKTAMERITLLLCANMTGEEKLPVFVIGKSKQPRSFPKDLSKLPVRYRNSANAWMTGFLFKEWLYEWDNKLKIQDRRVLLLVDNCTAHPAVDDLQMITLKFLPPITTLLLQPMDMGVIKNFKGHYRSRLNDRIIASLDANPDEKAIDISKKITLLNALNLARDAWKELKPSTIVNCYSKAGLSACATEEEADMDDFHDVAINSALSRKEFEAMVEQDSGLETNGEMSNTDLLREMNSTSLAVDEEDDIAAVPLSIELKMEMLNCMRQFIEEKGMESAMPTLTAFENTIFSEATKTRQTTLDSFFK